MVIPSSSACSTSSRMAGIVSRLSRQAIDTSVAPRRRAVSATSTATLPPPITSTRLPTLGFALPPTWTPIRNFRPESSNSPFSSLSDFPFQRPVARNKALDSAP